MDLKKRKFPATSLLFPSNALLLISSTLLLAFILTLALVSNRATTNALDTSSNGSTTAETKFNVTVANSASNPTSSSVAIFVNEFTANADNSHSMTILPSPNGNVSSVVSNIRVAVNDVLDGYYLNFQSTTANMVGQTNGNTLVPINGTINSPATFTPSNCNAWGFATPAATGGNQPSQYFDTNYAIESNKDVSASTSKYAAVPTTATLIYRGFSKKDETRSYYFAACANSTLPADIYQATVIWTAYAYDAPFYYSTPVVVDLDPNMVPVRWNYGACTYGYAFGNVMDSDPTTNVTPTDLSSINIDSTACWVKADPNIYDTFTNDDWHNYTTTASSEQDIDVSRDTFDQPYFPYRKMANAVTFANATYLNTYKNAAVGTPIPESAIAGYWTYVPRFSYKVKNFTYDSTNYPGIFAIIPTNANNDLATTKLANIDTSLDYNTSNPPIGSDPMTLNPTAHQYLTPPAFTFNGQELNGLWFGKYGTTGTATAPTVKPSAPFLVNQNVSSQFQTALLFGNQGISGASQSFAGANQHNFANPSKVKSHMAKNSEWGVLVYFTNSTFGTCSYYECTVDPHFPATSMAATTNTERVRNNAFSSFITGCGPDSLNSTDDTATNTCNPYNTQLGVLASTTHNVYGIYDTAGGVWEKTAGVYATGNGSAANAYTPVSAGSGFTNLTGMLQTDAAVYSPYFDIYPNPSLTSNTGDIIGSKYGLGSAAITSNANWGIYAGKLGLGHGIFEASGWSGASNVSVLTASPWFVRGGHPNDITFAGVEAIAGNDGTAVHNSGFRTVLVILP